MFISFPTLQNEVPLHTNMEEDMCQIVESDILNECAPVETLIRALLLSHDWKFVLSKYVINAACSVTAEALFQFTPGAIYLTVSCGYVLFGLPEEISQMCMKGIEALRSADDGDGALSCMGTRYICGGRTLYIELDPDEKKFTVCAPLEV